MAVCTNDYYGSGAGLAKCYIWDKRVECMLMELAKDKGVTPTLPVNLKRKSKNSSKGLPNSSESEVLPSVSLTSLSNGATIRLGRTMRRATREELDAGLVQSYPQLPFFQSYADGLNKTYHQEAPEEMITFTPTYTFSARGYCTNIGIRATSHASGLPSREKARSEGRDVAGVMRWREDYLAELFGLPYELLSHYDVKSSIYRTTYWLNTGEWLPQSVDFYPLMYAGLRPDDPDSYEFEDAAQRAEYKQGCMRLYFCKSAEEQWNKMRRAGVLPAYYTKAEQMERIREARRRMQWAVGGKTYGPGIFLHESCLLMMLRGELYQRGVQTSQCYDGFWSDDERLGELCEELLPKVAEEYRQRWFESA